MLFWQIVQFHHIQIYCSSTLGSDVYIGGVVICISGGGVWYIQLVTLLNAAVVVPMRFCWYTTTLLLRSGCLSSGHDVVGTLQESWQQLQDNNVIHDLILVFIRWCGRDDFPKIKCVEPSEIGWVNIKCRGEMVGPIGGCKHQRNS